MADPVSGVLDPGAGGGAPPAGGPAAADTAPPAAWYAAKESGIDAAHHPYMQNKGWDTPGKMLESYVSMEKVVGLERSGQSDRIVVLPKALLGDAKPEEIEANTKSTTTFWERVGAATAPKDAAGYGLKINDAYKDNPLYTKAGEIFKSIDLPGHYGQKVLDAVTTVQAAMDKEMQDRINSEEATLAKDPKFAETQAVALRAINAAGIDKETASLLGAVLGPKKALEVFAKLGAGFKEGATPPSGDKPGGAGFQMTKESAAAKAADMRKDPAFQARFLSPNPAVRKIAIEEIEALDKAAAGG